MGSLRQGSKMLLRQFRVGHREEARFDGRFRSSITEAEESPARSVGCGRILVWSSCGTGNDQGEQKRGQRKGFHRTPGPKGIQSSTAQDLEMDQERIWPVPTISYFEDVSSASAKGPRQWSFWVLMPISAPKPNSAPSVKRVEAFQ